MWLNTDRVTALDSLCDVEHWQNDCRLYANWEHYLMYVSYIPCYI